MVLENDSLFTLLSTSIFLLCFLSRNPSVLDLTKTSCFLFTGPKNSEAEATARVVQEDAGQRHHRANRARLQRHLQASPRGQPPVRGRTPLLRG